MGVGLAAEFVCMPYLDGCVSISRAARSGSGLLLFRALVLPSALLLFLSWHFARNWLTHVQACSRQRAWSIAGLGMAGALFLVLYVTALGNESQPNRGAHAANALAPPQQIQVSGFDPGWNYRRLVSISSPCGAEVAGYQVQVRLDSSFDFNKARPDGSDLRVTSDDGTTQVPFWIERWDSTAQQASIWVRLPQIPLSGTAVFLYYGNPNPPAQTLVETPPTGPWTRAPGNPIVPVGGPPNGQSLLAENIVYDSATAHYWMVHANYNDGGVGVGFVL